MKAPPAKERAVLDNLKESCLGFRINTKSNYNFSLPQQKGLKLYGDTGVV